MNSSELSIQELRKHARDRGLAPDGDKRFKQEWIDALGDAIEPLLKEQQRATSTANEQALQSQGLLLKGLEQLTKTLVADQKKQAQKTAKVFRRDLAQSSQALAIKLGPYSVLFALAVTVNQVGLLVQGRSNAISGAMGVDSSVPVNEGDTIAGFTVTSGFGEARQKEDGTPYQHAGVDLAMSVGTTLYFPVEAGTVECLNDPGGWGLYAKVMPSDPLQPSFIAGHLKHCAAGDSYQFAEIFAASGGAVGDPNAGRTTGPHLHWEQIEDGQKVAPTKGWLVQALTGNRVEGGLSEGDKVARLRDAIIQQESGGDCGSVNADSGALGCGQVMPANLPSWSKDALGREVSQQEFLANPDLQYRIVDHRLQKYWREELKNAKGNESQAVRRVAARWYSGRAELWNNEARQFYDGNEYPSIASYTKEVLGRYQGG